MNLFDQRALRDGVTKGEVLAWAGYDFANSGYTTVVTTAVFSAYFVGVVAGNASWATFLWTFILGLSNLAVMLTMPAIGARVDARASRKAWLLSVTLVCVACVVGLYWVHAGDILPAVLLIIVSNYCYALGETFCAAYLPELAQPDAMGRVSGWGWSFGYVGGMLALGVSLAWVSHVQAGGGDAEAFVPGTMLITAIIYLLAALPMFLFVRDRAEPCVQDTESAVLSVFDIRTSWQRVRDFMDFRRLLLVGFFFNAGVFVVISLTAVYAEQVMHFEPKQTMMLFFVVNIAAALGAFLFGYLEDRIGRPPACAGPHAGGLDRRGGTGGDGRQRHDVLGGGHAGRSLHGFQPVGGQGAGRCPGAQSPAGRVLWAVGLCHPQCRHCRAADLWHHQLGHRG